MGVHYHSLYHKPSILTEAAQLGSARLSSAQLPGVLGLITREISLICRGIREGSGMYIYVPDLDRVTFVQLESSN